MKSAKDSLLSDGLAALGARLPAGYSLSTSGLRRRSRADERWLVIRDPARRGLTCLVLARRRVEARDLGGIAAIAARAGRPVLVVSTFLSPGVRARLAELAIGCWDLTGNARITLASINLAIAVDSDASAPGKSERRRPSLAGGMVGRVARVLIDVRPPFSPSQLAELARVDASCATRTLAFLVEARLAHRRPRGHVEQVDWQALLRQWSHASPLPTRGALVRARAARGVPDFLSRLAQSGLLHALTGQAAFAVLCAAPAPAVVVLYVDDVPDAIVQLGLHPVADEANVVLVRPTDRSVYHRSRESNGLRLVSPSLMVADLDEPKAVDATLHWLAAHESSWRVPAAALLPTGRR
jgi:hypothetical protein